MHSKIIRPAIHGKKAYDNKGSCATLIHYLGHEGREKGEGLTFFNACRNDILPSEARQAIDGNRKGLRERETKFYSLVLSPSPQELTHIGNEADKLKAFTRQAMRNYAASFQEKQGTSVEEKDLVWYATIHQHRTHKGGDVAVKEGIALAGKPKAGLHTHVHVLVSKLDQSGQRRLNPQASKEQFHIKGWQALNEASFGKLFGYQQKEVERGQSPQKAPEQKPGVLQALQARISGKVARINGMLSKGEELSLKAVLALAAKRSYGQTFFYNLHRLEENLREGRPVHQPLHLLEHNKDQKPALDKKASIPHAVSRVCQALGGQGIVQTEELALPELKGRFRRRRQRLPIRQKGGLSR
ncbi:DUF5712 family protein [Rhodocytophaga aerolata]|uniref:DUF5712 family protein n=1 Tax=Rhodocytophaga aerolata TaxID=455078 RepID=A0ABT8RF83_9BACT|nr:DUF5712 family protein [Rhodocytophaga aerolata]MDO1449843.1 DUF5712 family protein [Rhodocytophaga aerolata]